MAQHPIQPLVVDDHGVVRFKENKIVNYLLDNGGISMNKLAMLGFEDQDWEQFAQLIGYSHSGFGSLSYATDQVYEGATHTNTPYVEQLQQRINSLEKQIAAMKEQIQGAMDILENM